MITPEPDTRSPERKAADERIAAEPHLSIPEVPPGTPLMTAEEALARLNRRPVALAGVVENGVVRSLDPDATLPEHARVIIVMSAEG